MDSAIDLDQYLATKKITYNEIIEDSLEARFVYTYGILGQDIVTFNHEINLSPALKDLKLDDEGFTYYEYAPDSDLHIIDRIVVNMSSNPDSPNLDSAKLGSPNLDSPNLDSPNLDSLKYELSNLFDSLDYQVRYHIGGIGYLPEEVTKFSFISCMYHKFIIRITFLKKLVFDFDLISKLEGTFALKINYRSYYIINQKDRDPLIYNFVVAKNGVYANGLYLNPDNPFLLSNRFVK